RQPPLRHGADASRSRGDARGRRGGRRVPRVAGLGVRDGPAPARRRRLERAVADRPSLALGGSAWVRDGVDHARHGGAVLELHEQLAQEPPELLALGLGEPGQQLLLVLGVRGDGLVHHAEALRGEHDQHAPPILGIGDSLDQTRGGQALETIRHGAGGDQQRVVQGGGGQAVRGAGAPEGREDAELRFVQPVLGQDGGDPALEEARQTRHPGDHAHRRGVEVRTLSLPLLEDPVNQVPRRPARHRRSFLLGSARSESTHRLDGSQPASLRYLNAKIPGLVVGWGGRASVIGLAAGYDPTMTPRDLAEAFRQAEARGFEVGFFSETIELVRDSVTSLATIGLNTDRITLGCTQIVRLRTPLVMAQTLAALDELTGGRMMMAPGACTHTHAKRHGLHRADPGQSLIEWVEAIRLILTGERVSYHGEHVNFDDVQISFRPTRSSVPLFIPATSKKGLEIAGRIGDGVLLNATCSPEYSANAIEIVRSACEQAGRDWSQFKVWQIVNTSVEDDHRKALDAIR